MSYALTPNLGLFQPTVDGDDNLWGGRLNQNAATLDTIVGSIANVLHYPGVDPTGVADSTTAFRNALATGKSVWAPAGTYLIRGQLTVTGAQTLRGDGSATTLLVDGAFDPTVTTGVVVLTNTLNQLRPALSDLTIKFVQPPDLVTTAAVAAASGTSLTVANATGIVVGMSLVNRTHSNSILAPVYQTAGTATAVSAIAGNVLTLNRGITSPGVSAGDTLQFASVRSMFKTLAAGGTATPGGTGVQYPWAVYASPQGTVLIQRVMIIGAWNGIYVRGSSFQIEKADVFAHNIGLDIDGCFNFPSLIDYRFWPWGNEPIAGVRDALTNVYYDGQTVAANIGQCDGLGCFNFQSWRGHLNLTSGWSWGEFTGVMLDGDNTNLTITAAGGGWAQINNFYSTKGSMAVGKAFTLNAGNPKFRCTINGMQMISAATDISTLVQNGVMAISGGYFWDGLQGTLSMIQVAGTSSLHLSDTRLDASGPRTDTYIGMTGTASLNLHDVAFVQAAGAGGNAINASGTNVVAINNVALNGWGVLLGGSVVNNAYSGQRWLPASVSYAGDAAAAAAGVAVGQLYRNGSAVMVRVV